MSLFETLVVCSDDLLNAGCIYAITSDTDMLNAPYSLFARYSLCTMQQGRPGRAQSLWIICSMLNNRARHATVCISNQLGNAQTIYFPNFFLFQKLQQFDYNLKKFTKYIFRQPFFRCIFSFSLSQFAVL